MPFENLRERMLAPLGRERQLMEAPDAQAMAGLGHNLHEAQAVHAPLAGGWACGWSTRATPHDPEAGSVRHMGGTSVMISASPATGTVVAVLTNSSTGAMFANLVANQLLEGVQPALPSEPTQGLGAQFDRYCGRYGSATLDITVFRTGDDLHMSDPLGGEAELAMRYLGGSTFEVSLGFLITDITFIEDTTSKAIGHAHVALRALPRIGPVELAEKQSVAETARRKGNR